MRITLQPISVEHLLVLDDAWEIRTNGIVNHVEEGGDFREGKFCEIALQGDPWSVTVERD